MNLHGCGTALVTPFRSDGAVDEHALETLVDWQIESGVSFLIPCGTTGEAATLTDKEAARVVQITCEAAAGRVPVFAGCTHNATDVAVDRARRLAKIYGLTGLLTANPYYNRPNQEGQYQHFRAVASAVDLPVLLYNIPARTGANLEPATVRRLAQIPNVIGIKESSGNLTQATELLTTLPGDFSVFAGDDGLVLPFMSLGAAGLISVASNVIPRAISELVGAAAADDWQLARRLNKRYFRLMQALFIEPSPGPVKAVLNLIGRGKDVLRLPMVPVSAGTRRTLETVAGELGLLVDHVTRDNNLRVF